MLVSVTEEVALGSISSDKEKKYGFTNPEEERKVGVKSNEPNCMPWKIKKISINSIKFSFK